MNTLTVTLINGAEITGKVVHAFDNLVGIETGKCITFINANQIVTFTPKG